MKIKLSPRAWEVLLVIDERSDPSPDGRFWCPALHVGCCRGDDDWCDRLGYHVNISGSGDARIIKSLRSKGLIAKRECATASLNDYSSHITEDGRLLVERSVVDRPIPPEAGVLMSRRLRPERTVERV